MLYIVRGAISSSTNNVQHSPDDTTAAIVRQNTPHTPDYWWRGDRDEANQCMGMIRRPGQRQVGEFGQDTGVTSLLFFEGHPEY